MRVGYQATVTRTLWEKGPVALLDYAMRVLDELPMLTMTPGRIVSGSAQVQWLALQPATLADGGVTLHSGRANLMESWAPLPEWANSVLLYATADVE